MLARGDSLGIQSLPAASPPPFPAWARAFRAPETDAEAAFLAGAALSRLDAIVRQNPPWAGVWRQRLALSAAAASVRRAGRTEDEARLARRVPPQPAGRRSRTRRKVPARLAGARRPPDPAVAVLVGRRRRGSRGSSRRSAGRGRRGGRGLRRLRPAGAVRRRARFRPGAARPDLGRGAPVGWRPGRGGRGALGLARRRRARSAAELAVRAPLARRVIVPGAGRRAGGPENPADGGETTRVVFAYARAAAGAVDLAGDLARRAEKLQRPRPNCAPRGQGPRCGLCSTRIASPHRQKLAGNCRSAARGGCSTGWLRSARSGN